MKTTENIKFFLDHDLDIHQEICKVMSYKYLPAESILFEYGKKLYKI